MADIHTTLVHYDLNVGEPVFISPLVRRLTAGNPSSFTGPGTNTYIIGTDRYTVVDPGPDKTEHIDAILKATDGKIDRVLATHLHEDHSPAALPLVKETGATMIGFSNLEDLDHLDDTFRPEKQVEDGEVIDCGDYQLEAIHTPGHLKRHVCFLLRQEQLLFAGDHIMQGATVVIVPPHGGTMWEYLDSLMKLKGRGIKHLAPAHGHVLAEPDKVLQELYDHRMTRENKAIAVLKEHGSGTIEELAPFVYPEISGDLIRATHLALWSHLQKLVHDGIARKHHEKHWIMGEETWEYAGD
ncbi:MBL fold metallo-hydrolase [Pseudomaricurvus alkylphenolicus]|jgi:glyoxylase-like metal-dependent hydrolase (beta-lactamase superfamily II)|uniref:MBL fold metallo-hydrolase n=1 Tax=Pseudomaricurvus alkylphenolicus TaxID=1306991 RepID=UPI001420AC05|nr:MBL fold metallo-hydrolase [Pseudomaricurvus alkylphenolicus]NIB42032.1 MBL fold metallo-hydrolase [Pseudomaricurvus alkylphenolicus]